MPITPQNLLKHELIGLKAEVKSSTDRSQEHISGEIMDETKSMLRIEDKWVEKKNCRFVLLLPDETKIEVNGQLIEGRPEERLDNRSPEKWEYID